MRQLNEALDRRAQHHLAALRPCTPSTPAWNVVHPRGSTRYNISLINFCEPEGEGDVPLRDEPIFGLGTTSVSWHADSSLQDFSTIGVYQHVLRRGGGRAGGSGSAGGEPWRVAVRVVGDDETPALNLSLRQGDTYYMLDDFNHHHHHAVLTGTAPRYSSTHRVSVVEKDTWAYVRGRCAAAREAARAAVPAAAAGGDGLDEAAIRLLGEIHTEVEMEWLRMFFVQGARHLKAHSGYWRPIMEDTLLPFWAGLERWARRIVDALVERAGTAAAAADGARPTPRAYSMMIYLLRDRDEKRRDWAKRYKSPAYAALEPDCRPLRYPKFPNQAPLPFDLSETIQALAEAKARAAGAGGGGGSSSKGPSSYGRPGSAAGKAAGGRTNKKNQFALHNAKKNKNKKKANGPQRQQNTFRR